MESISITDFSSAESQVCRHLLAERVASLAFAVIFYSRKASVAGAVLGLALGSITQIYANREPRYLKECKVAPIAEKSFGKWLFSLWGMFGVVQLLQLGVSKFVPILLPIFALKEGLSSGDFFSGLVIPKQVQNTVSGKEKVPAIGRS